MSKKRELLEKREMLTRALENGTYTDKTISELSNVNYKLECIDERTGFNNKSDARNRVKYKLPLNI